MRAETGFHAFDMVRVVHRLPAPALHLLQCRAGVLEPPSVVPVDPAGRICHPGELGDVFRKSIELRLPRISPGLRVLQQVLQLPLGASQFRFGFLSGSNLTAQGRICLGELVC